MKLSTRARYGLKALIDLGLHSANEAISLQSIAERQDISTSYLEQLMAMLKKAGLVKSSRGAYGGYQLGKPADEISVGEVLRVLEGSLKQQPVPGLRMTEPAMAVMYVWQNSSGRESMTVLQALSIP